jgi:hypothetical protein
MEKELKQAFEMIDLGDVKLYLGTNFAYEDEGIFVSQHRYIQHLLECFRTTYCRTSEVPMHEGTKLCMTWKQ